MSRSILISVLGFLLLAACSGEQTVNPDSGRDPLNRTVSNPFEFGIGETVTVTNEGVSVTFMEVIEDSRCPTDVVCFWEGRVTLGLEVTNSQSDTFFVPVSMRPGTLGPIPPPKDTLGFRFALIDVTPYPVSTDTIADSEYMARLAVFRLDAIDSLDGEVLIQNDPPPVGDAFELDTVVIEDDVLYATVWHSGGCGDHEYELYFAPPGFAESYPVQATLKFRHADLDDPCDAYLKRELAFDLRPLAQAYEIGYERRDCIIVHVSDELAGRPETRRVTARYYPTGMTPLPPCNQMSE